MLGKLRVASAYATAPDPTGLQAPGGRGSAAVTDRWGITPRRPKDGTIAVPAGANAGAGVRSAGSRSASRGLWAFARTNSRISIGIDGRPLPIYGHGMYVAGAQREFALPPISSGSSTPA